MPYHFFKGNIILPFGSQEFTTIEGSMYTIYILPTDFATSQMACAGESAHLTFKVYLAK